MVDYGVEQDVDMLISEPPVSKISVPRLAASSQGHSALDSGLAQSQGAGVCSTPSSRRRYFSSRPLVAQDVRQRGSDSPISLPGWETLQDPAGTRGGSDNMLSSHPSNALLSELLAGVKKLGDSMATVDAAVKTLADEMKKIGDRVGDLEQKIQSRDVEEVARITAGEARENRMYRELQGRYDDWASASKSREEAFFKDVSAREQRLVDEIQLRLDRFVRQESLEEAQTADGTAGPSQIKSLFDRFRVQLPDDLVAVLQKHRRALGFVDEQEIATMLNEAIQSTGAHFKKVGNLDRSNHDVS